MNGKSKIQSKKPKLPLNILAREGYDTKSNLGTNNLERAAGRLIENSAAEFFSNLTPLRFLSFFIVEMFKV